MGTQRWEESDVRVFIPFPHSLPATSVPKPHLSGGHLHVTIPARVWDLLTSMSSYPFSLRVVITLRPIMG